MVDRNRLVDIVVDTVALDLVAGPLLGKHMDYKYLASSDNMDLAEWDIVNLL
jgi:hypothetical protein